MVHQAFISEDGIDTDLGVDVTDVKFLGVKIEQGYKAYKEFKDNLPEQEYQELQIKVINECMRVLKQDGSLFYVHKNRLKKFRLHTPYEWLLKVNAIIRQEIIVDNTNEINQDARRFIPCHDKIFWLSKEITHINNFRRLQDCWVFRNKIKRKNSGHPATYPIDIVIAILEVLPNARLVYDPYMGSGTTALACIDMNRNYIGSEIIPYYWKRSIERIEEYNNNTRDN
jgi:modification methylase